MAGAGSSISRGGRSEGSGSRSLPLRAFIFILPFILLYISGASSLVYEIVWKRMLVLVMGNTTIAAGTILAAFMAGLSLGSYFWGRYIDNWPGRAMAVFGCLETATGLYALIFPVLLIAMSNIEILISASAAQGYYTQLFIRFLVCFFLLLPPTFLMGGTLAVMGEFIIKHQVRFGRDAALLYGFNTAGAVTGAFLAGFYLIRLYGHDGSIFQAALANLIAGLIALLVHYGLTKGRSGRRGSSEGPWLRKALSSRPSPRAVKLTVIAITASGFCTMAYEVMWTRLLMIVVDNSVYSFTIILVAILAGLAFGSLILAPIVSRISSPLFGFAVMEIGIGVLAFIFPFYIKMGPADFGQPYWSFLLVKLPLIILAPAVLMGATLPLAAEIFQAREERVGSSLGRIIAYNTIGGVLGATAAGFYFIPSLGFYETYLILPTLNVTLGAMLLTAWFRRAPGIAVIAFLMILVFTASKFMPPDFFNNIYAQIEPKSKLIYYDEGLAATACIFERPDGIRALYLNGIPEVDTSRLSMNTFKLMGTLPAMLHKDPESALMVTFGAGVTAGAAARFVDRIDCVDLAEQYRDIGKFFSAANNRIVDNPKFTMFIDDARHFLKIRNRSYSIIVSDATHPRSYDSWVLFTSDFYELVKSRLREDGIFCQWAPFHGLEPGQYKAIIKTFHKAFPHASVWNVGGSYSLLVGTPNRLEIDFNRMVKLMSRKDVRKDLSSAGLNNPFEILSHFMLGEEKVRQFTAETREILTDNSPAHLFFPIESSLKEQYESWLVINHRELGKYRESIIPYVVNAGENEGERSRILEVIKRRELRGLEY